jgi:hypothetical protein
MIKKMTPIVLRPVNEYGCWERRVASAPVDMVHSNHDHVKWSRRLLMGSL